MAWLESISTTLVTFFQNNGPRVVLITLVTAGLAWGIRPALLSIFERIMPRWSRLGATLAQIFIVLGGVALVSYTAGSTAILTIMAPIGAFLLGNLLGGQTLLADLMASARLRAHSRFQVGDRVTVGNRYHGVVTKINRLQTTLDMPGQAQVMLRNSQVVRSAVLVHPPGSDANMVALLTQSAAPVQLSHNVGDAAGLTVQDGAIGIETISSGSDVPPVDPLQVGEHERGAQSESQAHDNVEPTKPEAPRSAPGRHARSIPVASQLTKRTKMGKRTVQKLR
ncbi:MAG: mechanosensitive ion channel family protein [Caldilineaceae bacterium]|nr:mechanosensitive ion channel family protein [Caldilineaceae bacterium]